MSYSEHHARCQEAGLEPTPANAARLAYEAADARYNETLHLCYAAGERRDRSEATRQAVRRAVADYRRLYGEAAALEAQVGASR